MITNDYILITYPSDWNFDSVNNIVCTPMNGFSTSDITETINKSQKTLKLEAIFNSQSLIKFVCFGDLKNPNTNNTSPILI